MDDLPRILDSRGRRRAGPGAHAEPLQDAGDARVEALVDAADPVEEGAFARNRLGQLLVERVHREGSVRPEGGLGAVHAGPAAVPDLLLPVARPHEERERPVSGGEHRYRLRFLEPREPEEVAVRAVGMVDVVVANGYRGGRKDRHRRARRDLGHLAEHENAAGGEYVGRKRRSEGHGIVLDAIRPRRAQAIPARPV